jgi:hypothetical protein
MRTGSVVAFILGAVLIIAPLVALSDDRALTNADVVKMSQSHFSDATLIAVIQTHKVAFDVSSDGLMALKKAGVSDAVIHAMVDAVAAQAANASTAMSTAGAQGSPPSTGPPSGMPPNMPALPPEAQAMMQSMGMMMPGSQSGAPSTKVPDVWLVDGAQRTPMKHAMTSTVQNGMQGMSGMGGSNMLGSLAQQGLGMASMALGPIGAVAGGLFGLFSHPKAPPKPHMHMVWALPNPQSQNVVRNASPRFELSYGDIPGINPDSFEATIVKLEPTKDNWRLIGATDQEISAETFMGGTPPADSIVENRVDVIIKQIDRGHVQITPEKPLDPGEYGVVIRPDKEADRSHDVGGPAANQLFYTVWDFEVAGTPAQPAPAPTPSSRPD